MRIILTCNHSPWSPLGGGAQRSTHLLAGHLAAGGHDVTAVYTRHPRSKIAAPADVGYDVRWALSAAASGTGRARLQPLNTITIASEVRKLLRQAENPAIVHAQGEEAALIPIVLRRYHAFGTVSTIRHGYFPPELLERRSDARLSRIRRNVVHAKYALQSSLARRADVCTALSNHAAALAVRALDLPPEHVRVVPNGIDEHFFDVARGPGAPRGPLLYYGRFTSVRGFDTLLDTLAFLGEDCPETLLIGHSPEDFRSVAAVRQHGLAHRVRLLPWTTPEELANRLADASAAVFPSRHESFGNAIAEAMAAGTPVIATSAGAIPELIDEGRTGSLVRPDDPQALAAAIQQLRADPGRAEEMAELARRTMKDRFQFAHVIARYEAIYLEALARV